MRLAAAWAAALVAVTMLGAPPVGAEDPAPAVTGAAAASDSAAVTAEHVSPVEPGGPDVRDVRSGGLAELLDARPLSRYVGSGRLGDRASLARGVLPAGMSVVLATGWRLDDRLEGGLAIPSARTLADGTLVMPSGPDLTLLPLRTASAVGGPVEPADRPAGRFLSAISVSPGRRPGPTPWARISMGRGDLDWSSTGVEFGRVYRGGRFGLSGFLELEESTWPAPGVSRDSEQLGGRATFEIEGGWRAEVAAMRSALDREAPVAAVSVDNDRVRSNVRLALSRGRSGLEVFHTASWVRSVIGGARRSAESTADGVAATIALGGPPLESVRLEVARVGAEGTLLDGDEGAIAVSGFVSGRIPLTLGVVGLSAGSDWLGDSAVPSAAATLLGGAADAPWSVSAEVGGRIPTAIERLAAAREVPGLGGEGLVLEGNEALEPERAFVVRADYSRLDLLSGIGLRAELADVSGAITVAEEGGRAAHPVNAGDDLAGAAALWAAAGDSAGPGARATLDVFWIDEDGPLASLEPVPSVSLAGTTWWVTRFFEGGYLEVRWELSIRHERGLARGPWEGLVDDGFTSVDACAAARAGAVRFFLEVRDLLDARGARVPDRPVEGRRIAAGFSTSLWN